MTGAQVWASPGRGGECPWPISGEGSPEFGRPLVWAWGQNTLHSWCSDCHYKGFWIQSEAGASRWLKGYLGPQL